MGINNFLKLVAAVFVCQLAGIIGSISTFSAIPTWYAGLAKPALNPPSWLFGPVWIMLYTLMGIALFLVYIKEEVGEIGGKKTAALGAFGIQLFLNALWSIIFFGLHDPFFALVNIVLLWLAIAWTMIVFYKISRPAAYLLLPYIVWVSIAAYLNYSLWILN